MCTTSSQQAQQALHVLKVVPPVTAMMTCLPTCQPSSEACSAQLASCTFLPCALAWHASGLHFTNGELASKPSVQPGSVLQILPPAGIAGLATAMLKLLLRLPPNLQTVRAFPIGLTQENMLAEPILRALYDVVSIPPVDKVCSCLQLLAP